MDNLSVQKARSVKALYEELGLEVIYNVHYSPQFNGIESYFSLVKQQYKKMILKKMINGNNLIVKSLIKQAISRIDDHKVINCVKDGVKYIMNIE
jgi:hypothetical protein